MYRCWVNFFIHLRFQRIVRRSVSSTPCVWWSSWKPAAPVIQSTATASTSPCAARMATPTPTTVFDTRQSVWARPSSPSSIQGHVVSGAGGWDGWCLLWGFERANVLSNQSLSSSVLSLLIFIAYSICFTSASPKITMHVSTWLKHVWNGLAMLCERVFLGNSNRQDLCDFFMKTVPSLLHLFTSHPSSHPCHASSRHLTHTRPKRSTTFMFHSSTLFYFFTCLPLRWLLSFFFLLCLCVFVLCVAISCIKKLFFLVSVNQSVCLSIFVLVAVFLAVWLQVESGVT